MKDNLSDQLMPLGSQAILSLPLAALNSSVSRVLPPVRLDHTMGISSCLGFFFLFPFPIIFSHL